MGKKVREVIALLEMHGWRFVRERGDHKMYAKEGNRTIAIPGKMSDEMPSWLYFKILREAGLKKSN
ncbi:MAG: type II toxin-antitoxin system HicA family toxin [Bacteroidales bacterium]|nr:type II toxin-antitoxin system HicA family toxin [Bacteroidales bacterium]